MQLAHSFLNLTLAFLPTAATPQGRGDYLNFEAPQVKPITVAVVEEHPYLLVCNTPDNSVEVYDIELIESQPAADPTAANHGLVARIPVGLEPVSVLFHRFDPAHLPEPGEGMPTGPHLLYTANWLGDSVTFVQIDRIGGTFSYRVLRTADLRGTDDVRAQTRPGDEPMDLALLETDDRADLIVTKRFGSSLSILDAFSGAPTAVGGSLNDPAGGADVIMTTDGAFPWDPTNPSSVPTGAMAVKEPHTVHVTPGSTRAWVLGHQGGGSLHPESPGGYDLDVWSIDMANPNSGSLLSIGGLGTTNFNLAQGSDGSLFVVGTQARNDVIGNAALRNVDSGFVATQLHKITFVAGSNPPLVQSKLTRDLNRKKTKIGMPGTPIAVDPETENLAHATDVEVYRGQIVCLVAFNSDRLALVDTTATNALNWKLGYANIAAVSGVAGDVAGPRGLAVRLGPASGADRIYVLNRLENSVSVVRPDPDGVQSTLDPVVVDQFLLDRDPVPEYVRDGQKFLYSTRFSGSVPGKRGFVACASCHVDARSDQQLWSLTPEDDIPLDYDPELSGVDIGDVCFLLTQGYPDGGPNGKGPKITQSLQGLLNGELAGESLGGGNGTPYREAFDLVTNAPYHWRGDKQSFVRFNEAFHGLQGMPDIGTLGDPKGIPDTDMEAFEAFVNSIHYPPNPLQSASRTYRDLDPTPDGKDGALLGLELFHTEPTPEVAATLPDGNSFASRSCVQCHSLPEGSNNRVVSILTGALDVSGSGNGGQPLEAAALRGLRQKERRLELDPAVVAFGTSLPARPLTGDFGMGNEGATGGSLNGFLQIINKPSGEDTGPLTDINAYLREFDVGVAPLVGKSVTVLPGQALPTAELDLLEGQARDANCGIAVYLRDNGVERGFWYRVSDSPAGYIENGPSAGPLSSADLLSLLSPGDVLVFTATPLGSERRVASLDATPDVPPSIVAPTAQLEGTAPISANVPIVGLTANWVDFWTGSLDEPQNVGYLCGGPANPTVANPPPEPLHLRTIKILQDNLEAAGFLGTLPVAHDAPRRLRVRAMGLVEGCVLKLGIYTGASGGTPPISASPSDPLFHSVELPLYPTDELDLETGRIWETAIEFDSLTLYTLLMGGPHAPGVSEAFGGTDVGLYDPATNPGGLDPLRWNWYRVEVVNPGPAGMSTVPQLQPLVY
jgi:hypothetical protein